MSVPIVVGQVYMHTTYINDRTPTNTPTQCAILRRYWKCVFLAGSAVTDTIANIAFDNTFAPLYIALLNNNANYRGSTLARVTGTLPLESPVSTIANAAIGTAGATALPKQAAGLLSLYTGFRGKHYRGRVYLPFPSSTDDTGDGSPTAGYVTRLGNLGTALLSVVTATSGASSAQFNAVTYTKNVLFPPQAYTSFAARGAFATQKRRGDYGRINVSPI